MDSWGQIHFPHSAAVSPVSFNTIHIRTRHRRHDRVPVPRAHTPSFDKYIRSITKNTENKSTLGNVILRQHPWPVSNTVFRPDSRHDISASSGRSSDRSLRTGPRCGTQTICSKTKHVLLFLSSSSQAEGQSVSGPITAESASV